MGPDVAGGGAVAGPEPTITVDGIPIPVRPGATIGAALLAAGFRTLRRTRGGRPRGLYCGIGACFDCLVSVNGGHPRRACLEPARPGDVVVTADPPAGGGASGADG